MRHITRKVVTVTAAAVAAAGLAVAPASALPLTADVTLAGTTGPTQPVTGESVGNVGGLNQNRPAALSCTPSASAPALSATGTVKVGSGLSPTGLAALTSVNFNNPCTAVPGPVPTTVTAVGVSASNPWSFNATGTTNASGVTTGRLTGVTIELNAPSIACKVLIEGDAGPGSGYIGGTYTNPAPGSGDPGTLKLSTVAADNNLKVTQILQGPCPTTLIQLNDRMTVSGTAEVFGDNSTNNEGPIIDVQP
ncbi:hypothetical protein [Actinomadura geliboluensis]|uniref:hypothetical protein n=1 Tax=Actinomadura geliboluensis TaxID=882440 RepID=UPI0037140A82